MILFVIILILDQHMLQTLEKEGLTSFFIIISEILIKHPLLLLFSCLQVTKLSGGCGFNFGRRCKFFHYAFIPTQLFEIVHTVPQLWLRTSPVHSLVFLHNKDIFCQFGSFLVNSGHFQLTSIVSTTFLLVELVAIKHGCHIVSCLYQQPQGGYASNI